MAFEEFAELVLKGEGAMMFGLMLNVTDDFVGIGLADGDGPVTALPMEIRISRALGLQPFRRSRFKGQPRI